MDNAAKAIRELIDALEALSPEDFTAWNNWMESRLTERLRRRLEHGAAPLLPRTPGEDDE